jgi:hypothetical protein
VFTSCVCEDGEGASEDNVELAACVAEGEEEEETFSRSLGKFTLERGDSLLGLEVRSGDLLATAFAYDIVVETVEVDTVDGDGATEVVEEEEEEEEDEEVEDIFLKLYSLLIYDYIKDVEERKKIYRKLYRRIYI